jgi:hypothetical protein
MFHRHKLVSSTLFASDLPLLKFIKATHIHSKSKFYIKYPNWHADVRCPDHPSHELNDNGSCRAYCSFKINLCDVPDPKTIVITITKCLTCNYYQIKAQNSEYIFDMNVEYAKILIDKNLKAKEDAEMERLLNYGNPDYDKKKMDEGHKKIIINLQEHLRTALHNLNKSLLNDGIWEVIPDAEKKKLIKKYSPFAKTYNVNVDETVRKIMKECES